MSHRVYRQEDPAFHATDWKIRAAAVLPIRTGWQTTSTNPAEIHSENPSSAVANTEKLLETLIHRKLLSFSWIRGCRGFALNEKQIYTVRCSLMASWNVFWTMIWEEFKALVRLFPVTWLAWRQMCSTWWFRMFFRLTHCRGLFMFTQLRDCLFFYHTHICAPFFQHSSFQVWCIKATKCYFSLPFDACWKKLIQIASVLLSSGSAAVMLSVYTACMLCSTLFYPTFTREKYFYFAIKSKLLYLQIYMA